MLVQAGSMTNPLLNYTCDQIISIKHHSEILLNNLKCSSEITEEECNEIQEFVSKSFDLLSQLTEIIADSDKPIFFEKNENFNRTIH